jgi:ubiquinone/menaquinone biosynthesis C-methylase UbiE
MNEIDVLQYDNAVRQTFDGLASSYDNPSTRFFPFSADRLVSFVKPRPGSKVLDVATGTAAVAVPFAQAVGPQGRVSAIDFSSAMLGKAEVNIRKMALDNIDLHEMDAQKLDFKSGYFHYVVCSYGLFFMPDMQAALGDWVRVLRPGGTLAFTSFEETAFQPMLDHFIECLQAFGVQLPEGPFGSRRISSIEHCRELLDKAGLESLRTEIIQVGYHLPDESAWWEVVLSTGMRAFYEQVPEDQRDAFQEKHLGFVAEQKTDDGLWMDVQTRFASGCKPG